MVSLRDFNHGVLGQAQEQGRSLCATFNAFHDTLATAIHVAHAEIAEGLYDRLGWIVSITCQGVITHNTTFHLNEGLAVFCTRGAWFVIDDGTLSVDARQGQTTATVDVAIDLSASHFNGGVALHTACGVVLLGVVTAAAEDVAIVAGGAVGTHEAVLVMHLGVA